LLLLLFPPASHGGVEREWLPAMLCGETGVGGLLLQVELIHAGGITASTILCWKAASSQPPHRRLFIPVAGARQLLATKWFVRGGLEMACGCGTSLEGRH
jgi:hypothetical protein